MFSAFSGHADTSWSFRSSKVGTYIMTTFVYLLIHYVVLAFIDSHHYCHVFSGGGSQKAPQALMGIDTSQMSQVSRAQMSQLQQAAGAYAQVICSVQGKTVKGHLCRVK